MIVSNEPTLESIEDYHGQESKEKREVIWLVIFSGLLIGVIYTYISLNSTVSDKIPNTIDIVQSYR